jgi:hypothetical protein
MRHPNVGPSGVCTLGYLHATAPASCKPPAGQLQLHPLRADREHATAAPAQCSHYFHLMCINTWLHNKNTCPICRRKWEFARREARMPPALFAPQAFHLRFPCFPGSVRSAPKPAPATPGALRTSRAVQEEEDEEDETE